MAVAISCFSIIMGVVAIMLAVEDDREPNENLIFLLKSFEPTLNKSHVRT